MAIHIHDFYIERFRGIRELNAKNVNHVKEPLKNSTLEAERGKGLRRTG